MIARLDRARRLARATTLRSEHRLDSLLSREAVFLLNNLVLVGALLRDLLGHVLPADLRGGDRQRRRRSGRRGSTATSSRWRSCSCCCPASGPVIAWRRATRREPAPQPRAARRPAALVVAACCCAGGRDAARAGAADVRPARAFVLGGGRRRSSWRGVRARRAMSRRAGAASRSSRSCGATGAATAATSCTSASRCCSSAWPPRRRSRTRATSQLGAGPDRRRSAATTSPTCKPTGELRAAANGRLERIDLGAELRVARDGRHGRHAAHRASRYFPSQDPTLGPGLALLRGRGDERGRPARRPAARRLDRDRARHRRAARRGSREGDKVFARRRGRCPPQQRDAFLGAGARRPRRARYADEPAAGHVPADRLAAGDLDLDRRADRLRRRPDRAVAGAARRARSRVTAPRYAARVGARARPRLALAREWTSCSSWSCCAVVVLVVSAPLRRGRAAADEAAGGGRARRARGRARRPSTARSATPSSTTAPASSPRPTGAARTARCAPRRWRSCAGSTLDSLDRPADGE